MSESLDRLNAALGDRYRIERMLGEGGMARVWLADDLKHGRQVAIKVLKPELAAIIGAERFLSEIRTTANLQHPHILALYDSGEADGILYYVMPYIDGESLRDRLDREKQLSVDDAIELTRSILSALDYAHRHDVIHRDIKPANILLHDGNALVSDFGIALAVTGASGDRMTETGLSLGTPHYMAPEQATADRDLTSRADIYSTACMLYEMLVGAPPHTGPSAQSVLVSILTEDPKPVTQVRRSVPEHVGAAIDRALEKLPADRFSTAGEFAAALVDPSFAWSGGTTRVGTGVRAVASGSSRATVASTGWWGQAPSRVAVGAAVVGFVLAGAAWIGRGGTAAGPSGGGASGSAIRVPFDVGIAPDEATPIIIAPDGSSFAWISEQGDAAADHEHGIEVRRASSGTTFVLPDTEEVSDLAYSPDGRFLVFAGENGRMMRISVDGGRSVQVQLEDPSREYDEIDQLHWSSDGHIYFADHGGIFRVPEDGGAVEQVVDGDFHEFGQPVPITGSDWLLYVDWRDPDGRQIITAVDPGDGTSKAVVDGNTPVFLPPDLLLYATDDQAVFAARIDPRTAELVGTSVAVIDSVAVRGMGYYSVSRDGTAVYWAGAFETPEEDGETLVTVGPTGERTRIGVASGYYRTPRFSPDGSRIVVQVGLNDGISVFDIRTGVRTRIWEGRASNAIWSPDGDLIAYARTGDNPGVSEVVVVDPDEPDDETIVRSSQDVQMLPFGWTSDGSELVAATNTSNIDIYRLPIDGSEPIPFLATGFRENAPALSPDGRWIAFESDREGPIHVYVRSFPDGDREVRVSETRGVGARWSADGARLMYRVGDTTRVATVRATDESFEVLSRADWFANDQPGRYISHEMHPDGDRVLVVRRPTRDTEPPTLRPTIVFNWISAVRAALATSGRSDGGG